MNVRFVLNAKALQLEEQRLSAPHIIEARAHHIERPRASFHDLAWRPDGMGWTFGPMGYGQAMNGQAGMMGPGMMGPDMMHLVFILMDSDDDGALSLEEYQQVHARIFGYLDSDCDGRLMPEELEAHMHSEMEGSQPPSPVFAKAGSDGARSKTHITARPA